MSIPSYPQTKGNAKKPVFGIPNNKAHQRVSALFLGPKAENAAILQELLNNVVTAQITGRQSYFPCDPDFISKDIQESRAYKEKINQMRTALNCLLCELNKHSIPFYSPRYSAHMTIDSSIPAILGYISTMFYNPNNVAFEASPYTTALELIVGKQMSAMMGYNILEKEVNDDVPLSWGHITCDGTVANLEAVWAARNLKFYALSLRDASAPGGPLEIINDSFEITTCKDGKKLLKECSSWELLNLQVKNVVEIPERLYAEHGISGKYLESALQPYLVQTTNKDELMKKWGITKQPVLFVPSTKHYSWPKSAAIAGIGSENAHDVEIDIDARMNTETLLTLLEECAKEERAVYMVVSVMGTTEEGAVDRLDRILKIRDEMATKGLAFLVHCDAAWGGYFASMLPRPRKEPHSPLPDYVLQVGLRAETKKQLRFLGKSDSITIDPHKAGYIPYPAGGLCYRDGRMRYLVTWTAPYINQSKTGESIGVYGVEGSKPGAAAAAVFMHHIVAGLTPEGHGSILGEASFTCRRFSSHWASMSDDKTPYIVVPFNRLPSEKKSDRTPESILKEKGFIRDHIIGKSNIELVQDQVAMTLLNKLGSDLNVNAFACNFWYDDGLDRRVNEDILEANWLNRYIFEKFSMTNWHDKPLEIPFYLTSTVFAQKDYGICADEFKRRLGLKGKQDLFVLRNVVMSPFSTQFDFVAKLVEEFKKVLEEGIELVRKRNVPVREQINFIVQGTDKLYFVHKPSFHMAGGRRQLIFTADIPPLDLENYRRVREQYPGLTHVRSKKTMLLDDLQNGAGFEIEVLSQDLKTVVATATISNVKIVKKRSLNTEDLDSTYPALMPFYLYGTQEQRHIDHMILLAPNIQLTANKVTLKTEPPLSAEDLAEGVIAVATNVHERAMQPFPEKGGLAGIKDFFFKEGKTLNVKVYRDPFPASTMDPIPINEVTELITEGSITLGSELYIDSDRLNADKDKSANDKEFKTVPSGQLPDASKDEWLHEVENCPCYHSG